MVKIGIKWGKKGVKTANLGGAGGLPYKKDEMDNFGSHFRLKIDEQIDAEIDAEKVMNIDENSMQHGPEIDL